MTLVTHFYLIWNLRIHDCMFTSLYISGCFIKCWYICVCVYTHVRARVPARARACAHVCMWGVSVCVCPPTFCVTSVWYL
jgi:hypothetical protein